MVKMGVESGVVLEWFLVCETQHKWMRACHVCLVLLVHAHCSNSFGAIDWSSCIIASTFFALFD